jgi:hypothetical protein
MGRGNPLVRSKTLPGPGKTGLGVLPFVGVSSTRARAKLPKSFTKVIRTVDLGPCLVGERMEVGRLMGSFAWER